MDLKINSSHVHARLSKIEVAIENIKSFTAVGNLAVNQMMERKVAMVVTTKVVYVEEPK
jgi:preprotein translocase subunit SecF